MADALVNSHESTPAITDKQSTSETWKTRVILGAFPSTTDPNSVYLLCPAGSKFPICGACSITVVAGSVKILGFVANETLSFEIAAPLSSAQYIVEAESGLSPFEIERRCPFLNNTLADFAQFAKVTVVCISKNSSLEAKFEITNQCAVAAVNGWKIRPVMGEAIDYINASVAKTVFDCAGVSVGCVNRSSVDLWNLFQQCLAAIVKESLESYSEKKPLVVMVCGEKNAGKSTTCRAIINSLLNKSQIQETGVGYLECDVGQTEFTPCSIVSWSLVKSPLLHPPFMHMKCVTSETENDKTFAASFYGDLSPGQSPNRYYQCLQSVFSRIPKECQNVAPLIVNTMGWIKSLGLALLVDTYRLVKPDIILHLRTPRDNSPTLDAAFFFAADGINSTTAGQGSDLPRHKLFELSVPPRPVRTKAIQYASPPPYFLRSLSTIGHFSLSNEVISNMSIKSLPHCRLPRPESTCRYLFTGICHERVPPSETRRALIGSVVALCKVDIRLPPGITPPSFLLNLPSGWMGNDWLGLGIVLDIDEANRTATVATPLTDHPEILSQVNCLMRGLITILDETLAEIVPEHLRQIAPPRELQVGSNDKDDQTFDAQRFGGRRDYMRRKREIHQTADNYRHSRHQNHDHEQPRWTHSEHLD